MNHQVVLFHLREGKEELDRTIAEIARESDYGYGEFQVAMSHIYHHLNTAWNGRDASIEQFSECSQQDFDAWKKFPPNSDLFLE